MAAEKLAFARFDANGKTDVKNFLNAVVPGQWVWSSYALSPVTNIDAVGSGRPPVLVVLQNSKAATMVRMMADGITAKGVRLKQLDMIEDDADAKRRALYSSKLTDWPWSEGETRIDDWARGDGLLIMPKGVKDLAGCKRVTQSTPVTLDQIEKIVGGPAVLVESKVFARRKVDLYARQGFVTHSTIRSTGERDQREKRRDDPIPAGAVFNHFAKSGRFYTAWEIEDVYAFERTYHSTSVYGVAVAVHGKARNGGLR